MKRKYFLIALCLLTMRFDLGQAQTGRSPFPMTNQEITNKIDSLRKIYAPYASRTFSSLNEADRKKVMIAKAREVVLTFAPGYYREYKEPVITVDTVIDPKKPRTWTKTKKVFYSVGSRKAEHIGKPVYVISFLYDKTKENVGNYIVRLALFQETGEPLQLNFPDNRLVVFDERSFYERAKEKPLKIIEYIPYSKDLRY